MAYSDTLNFWATATYNEINFVRWKRSDCRFFVVNCMKVSNLWSSGRTFHTTPCDRIVAKRVAVSSEEERPVTVTSLNWIRKSNSVAHLVVSFLYHHVECVVLKVLPACCVSSPDRIIDGETKNLLTHVAIHTPVYVPVYFSDIASANC
jgi:hypothetical protein